MRQIKFDDFLNQAHTARRNSIFVTFYFKKEVEEKALLASFRTVLPIPGYNGPLFDGYTDEYPPFKECYYTYFTVPNAKDCFALQIGLNSTDIAADAWNDMRQHLAGLLQNWYNKLEKCTFLGYTLVYKGDIVAEHYNADTTLSTMVIAALQPLFSIGEPVAISHDVLTDGMLFLMDTEADNAGLVYCALGNGRFVEDNGKKRWNQIAAKQVFGQAAELQFSDCIYHKSNFLRRQVDPKALYASLEQMNLLAGNILEIITTGKHTDMTNTLSELSVSYNKSLNLLTYISELGVSATQQKYNFQTVLEFNKDHSSQYLRFLLLNIAANTEHLDGLQKKSQLAIDKVKHTLDFLRIAEGERSARELTRYQNYIAIAGMLLASLQIIDNLFARQVWNSILPLRFSAKTETDFYTGVVCVRLLCSVLLTFCLVSIYRLTKRARQIIHSKRY